MKLKGFKKSDGSIAKIYTDPTLTESDSPADAASVKAKDDLLQQGITNNANYAAGLNTRLSELENGAPSIIAPKVTEWLNANVDPTGSAVTVDSSLTIAGSAADAKKTGDEITDLKSDLLELQSGGYVADAQRIGEVIDEWLDDHPEATTTVQDGSVTIEKFASSVVDATLTQEEHPADAKAVGDIVTEPLDINRQSTSDENTFTIATFNVLGTNYWRYPPNPPCDTDAALVAISRNILEVNPDIVGLQEVSKHPKYTQLEKICSVGYENKHFLGNHSAGIQNAFFGNAIISKNGFSFDSVEDTSWADQADEKRHLIKAVVTINDTPVSIYVTHLSLDDSNRDAEITDILSKIRNDTNDHIILIGDLNLEYQSAEYNRFVSSGLINTNGTYPTYIGSNSIIDFIFHSSNITVNSYNVLENSDASDHAMLWANLTLN